MLLAVGYTLALVALAVQLALAELSVRRVPARQGRWRPYLAIVLTAGASVAVTTLAGPAESAAAVRGLQVACLAVALTGALVVVRTVAQADLAGD